LALGKVRSPGALLLPLWLLALPLAAAPEPEQRLLELENALRQGEAQQQDIRHRVEAAAAAAALVRADLVNAAGAVQEQEDTLSLLEAQMADLSGIERDKGQTLERKRRQVEWVLIALQRLAFRPTEALIAQPTSPADTVRSAILLKQVVPRLEAQATVLKGDIESLATVRTDIAHQQERIALVAARLDVQHRLLRELYEKKQRIQEQTEEEQQSAERQQQTMATEAEDLRDLLRRLDEENRRQQQDAVLRLAAEKAARAAELVAARAALEARALAQQAEREAERAVARAAKQRQETQLAEMRTAQQAERLARQVAEAAEAKAAAAARETSRAAERTAFDQRQALQRANRPFSRAQGEMPFPARGAVVVRFGQNANQQGPSKGISIETRPGAQVIAPYDGQIVFAGPFRGYGLLLIIEHGEGYHTLLAGMARIDGSVGQHLATGEPVGVMGQPEAKPLLYVEFRHDGQPVNPLPWLTARKAKVSG